jgi:hypothetical protein
MAMSGTGARSWAAVSRPHAARAGRGPREDNTKGTLVVTNFAGLVDADNGLISRRIFIEPEIYAQGLDQIFARCWLFSAPRKPDPAAG